MTVALRSFASSVTRIFSCSKCEKTPTSNFVYGLLWLSLITRLDKKAQVLRHTIWDPPPQADWQFSSSFDGHVPLSPDVVSPPTLMGPKPVGCPGEPHGALRQPHKSISTGTLHERAPGIQMLYQRKEGKGGERKRRRKGKPQNSCLPASTHHTDSKPARSHKVCS